MANKQVDSTGDSGKMLKASAKDVREQQEKDRPGLTFKGIFVPFDAPDLCIWCQVYPARQTSDYCSDACAAQAEADNEV